MEPSKDLYRDRFKYFKAYEPYGHRKRKRVKHGKYLADSCRDIVSEPEASENFLLKHPNDSEDQLTENVTERRPKFPEECTCFDKYGLRNPGSWTVLELKYPSGLILVKNPFTPEGQRYWISRSLLDFANHPEFITNLDNLNRLEKIKLGESVEHLSCYKLNNENSEFYEKLRWVTFGYHHDWDTKIYTEKRRSTFPQDLAGLTNYIAEILGFSGFEAEAAIANYYHMDSTLSGHVDHSELNQLAPLFSLSFGQTAIFLIGGPSKSDSAQAILLESGDIAVMSGESRLSYHGVPKILLASCSPWEQISSDTTPSSTKRMKLFTNNDTPSQLVHDCDSFFKTLKDPEFHIKSKPIQWSPFVNEYINRNRVNLNVRQVLFPGQENLNCDCGNS